jgi:pyruvate/2-oxoacid:ferredoxin oxidoreductase alpha subunit
VQEVLDTLLIAYRLAEKVDLPAMVVLDAFFLSHTFEPVDVPDRAEVDAFLPPWRPEPLLDTANPRNVNQLCGAEFYEEFRMNLQKAMEGAVGAYVETDAEFGRRFGRSYGICEVVPAREGARAPMALLTTGSVTGTARATLPELAKRGFEADLVKLKLFRPFPAEELRRVLGPYGKVAVLDRNLSPGIGGIFAQEIRAALAPLSSRPEVHSFIAGLGGRDITPDTLAKIVERTLTGPPEMESVWADAKVIP